jgi:hypothetical protein
MMNKHSGSIELEVELLWLGEMDRWQQVAFHPTVIDGGARGVKGVGLTDKEKGLPAPLPPASRGSRSMQA